MVKRDFEWKPYEMELAAAFCRAPDCRILYFRNFIPCGQAATEISLEAVFFSHRRSLTIVPKPPRGDLACFHSRA